jgi:hypothetical protein
MYRLLLTIFAILIGFSFCKANTLFPKDSVSTVSDSLSDEDVIDDDSVFEFESYKAVLTNGILTISDLQGVTVYTREFNDPVVYTEDIDADSSDEFLVVDYQQKGSQFLYDMYVYKIDDEVKLADSISSGMIEPYLVEDEEMGSIIVVAGQPEFDYLNLPDSEDIYSPLQCYVFENGEFFDVNDELYDIFIDTNDDITAALDDFYRKNNPTCDSSKKMKAAIAEVYVNYLSAQEKSLAQKFIDSYYFCSDKAKFIDELNKLNEEE